MKRVLVPVDLGGSPTRCEVAPPPQPPPTPEVVAALVAHYAAERTPPDASLEVSFFGGGVPSDALLEAAGPWPIRLSCSPADLSQQDADRLLSRGVRLIELEALTLAESPLRQLKRGYTAARVLSMRQGLLRKGVAVALTLMPGLPGTDHASALDDVERALNPDAGPLEHVRLYPALALEGAGLARWVEEGRWRPMRLGEAVTTLVALMDRLDRAGVPVARVGLQPGQDLRARVVAGPHHPNLRGLVETRRYRRRLAQALEGAEPGEEVILAVNPKDLSVARGTANQNVRALRAALSLDQLSVVADPSVPRGATRKKIRTGV